MISRARRVRRIVLRGRRANIRGRQTSFKTSRGGFTRCGRGRNLKLLVPHFRYEYGVNRIVLAGPEGDLLDVGNYLAVWRKIDGEWFVSALSFTSDAPASVPMEP